MTTMADRIKTTDGDREQVYVDYANGLISRKKAMARLDIPYGELLDGLSERALHVPHLPDAEIERSARRMLEFLGRHPV